MLAGAAATFVSTGITGGPSDDADTCPPTSTARPCRRPARPNTFVECPGTGDLQRSTTSTWTSPRRPTRPSPSSPRPAAAGFTLLCPTTRACVPEPDGDHPGRHRRPADVPAGLPQLRDGHESLVGNYTVSRGGVAGVRWFELRNVTAGPVTVFQESTYQPDTTWRWMGSAAMDAQGNLALGFSASSARIYPADPLRRAAGDRPAQHAGAGRSDPVRRHRQPDRHRQPLGRLQRPDRGPGGRLHLLVHQRILRHHRQLQLAHAHRQLQVPRLRRRARTAQRISA